MTYLISIDPWRQSGRLPIRLVTQSSIAEDFEEGLQPHLGLLWPESVCKSTMIQGFHNVWILYDGTLAGLVYLCLLDHSTLAVSFLGTLQMLSGIYGIGSGHL
jgi:hypothetical protein